MESQEENQSKYYKSTNQKVAKNKLPKVVGEESRELLNLKSLASLAQEPSVSQGDQDVAKVFSKLRGVRGQVQERCQCQLLLPGVQHGPGQGQGVLSAGG